MESLREFLKKVYFHKDVKITYSRVYATIGSTGYLVGMIDAIVIRRNHYVAVLAFLVIGNLFLGNWLFERGWRRFVRVYRPITTMVLTYLCIQETGGINSPVLFWFSTLIMGAMLSYGIIPTLIVCGFELAIITWLNWGTAASNLSLYVHLVSSLIVILCIGVMFSKISDFYFSKLMKQKAKTEDKSNQIRALLDGIPQGIVTVGPGGTILPDYSRHLLTILEVESIEGDFFEAILSRVEGSKDIVDQCWQSLLAIIGEDLVNYEVNADKLPTELRLRIGASTRDLKFTWNAEVSDAIVSRILVTLLDVTAEKDFERKAQAQAKEFDLIRELIEIEPKKANQFFASSQLLLNENARYLQVMHGDAISIELIQTMFVNLHTVKGAARTLGLKELAVVLHAAEETYQRILKSRESIDLAQLQNDCLKVRNALEQLITINRVKLNRREDFSTVTLSRDFLESHYTALAGLTERIDKEEISLSELVQIIRDQKLKLIAAIYDQLPTIFEDYKFKARKIAEDLGKPIPRFAFDIPELSIKPEVRTLLDNCMIHLLRNALDHGIESRHERVGKGKSENGCLQVRASVDGEFLKIEFQDDGRGLAIGALRARGIERGDINPEASIQQIAELVFHSGVSTANSVSAISGRGIGMDAVRSFLQKQGGSIAIELGKPHEGDADYYAFRFVIRLHAWTQGSASLRTLGVQALPTRTVS